MVIVVTFSEESISHTKSWRTLLTAGPNTQGVCIIEESKDWNAEQWPMLEYGRGCDDTTSYFDRNAASMIPYCTYVKEVAGEW